MNESDPVIKATWERTFDSAEPARVNVSIEGKGSLQGTVISTAKGLELSISGFNVEEQHQGTGTQLMMGAAVLAQECGIPITAESDSPATIKIIDRLFPGRVIIKGTSEPMTPEQAVEYLAKGKELEEIGEDVYRTVEFDADIAHVNTKDWPQPNIQNRAPLELRRALYCAGVKPPRSERQIRQAQAKENREKKEPGADFMQ